MPKLKNSDSVTIVCLPQISHMNVARVIVPESNIIPSFTTPSWAQFKLNAEFHIKKLLIPAGASVVTDLETFTTVVNGEILSPDTIYEGPLEWHNVDVSFCGATAFLGDTNE